MPQVKTPWGTLKFVPYANPGDQVVGEPNVLTAGGVDLGQENQGGISTPEAITAGTEEGALGSVAAVAVPGIFSPKFRKVTSPEITPSKSVERRTSRSSY